MYYPYLRGKQYELVAIRENAGLMKQSGFVPIIEPVKESFSGLTRALDAIENVDGDAIVILNPEHGDHAGNDENIEEFVKNYKSITVGFIAGSNSSAESLARKCKDHLGTRSVAIVHAGFDEEKALVKHLGNDISRICHVFLERTCGKLYRKHFQGTKRVLIRDGFTRKSNREYPPKEPFSDLHVTFKEEGMDGFGDFLIVGDEYFESGGPAYAVAIHLTSIDKSKDEQMFVYHFVSDRVDTPADPAGKFLEALDKLVREVERDNSPIWRTQAVDEFLELRRTEHYPGLGYVKKLSMIHHLETLSRFFSESSRETN